MKKFILFVVVVFFILFLLSCKGDTGPAGANGTNGTDGSDGADGLTGSSVMIFQNGSGPYAAYDGTKCTLIMSGSPNDNFGTCATTTCGYINTSSFYDCRTLIKFDLSPLVPANSTVTAAYLSIFVSSAYLVTSVTTYQLTRNWTEGTGTCSLASSTNDASWNNYTTSMAWTTQGGDYSATPVSNIINISSTGWFTFTLDASMVQGWLTDPSSNNGVILVASGSGMDQYISIQSDESATVSQRPKLTVYYRLP